MDNVLICDDEQDIVNALKIYLSSEGYGTLEAYSGREALEIMEREEVHLVLLDVMMPEMNGLAAVSALREKYNVPVIFLSAKSEDTDKILGLNLGADDYVTKPYNPVELLARIRSQLRRYTTLGCEVTSPSCLRVGEIVLDDKAKTVTLAGEPVSLTPTEFAILKVLMEHVGEVMSPRRIYQEVRREEPLGAENIVAVHIRHLREKLEFDPASPQYLKVVWGQGYKLEGGTK